jgi:endonuclease/exonuclease/phosphatase family metal-dependent hydrolase
MATIFDTPPATVQADLTALSTALDAAIPPKRPDENILIATWNLCAFASLTRKWTATQNDSPKRDLRALRAIIDIVSRFDVVAIQEVKGDLRSLRDMMKFLGDDWAFLMTDVTRGTAGNEERMAFIFDLRRVKPSGLACELVVPPEWIEEVGEDALNRQFARTPYAASFLAGQTTFILVTLHVDYGDVSADRIPELRGIARWMADWARRTNEWEQNLIALGDFNIDRRGDALWQAFTSTGLTVPEDLNRVPRSIFADPGQPTLGKFYDQIAWFADGEGDARLNMQYVRGGSFDFVPYVYRDQGFTKSTIRYRMSDHYPLWVEFRRD